MRVMTKAEIVAATVYGEARGESYVGQLGVAWSIRNRVDDPGLDWWGDTYPQVCLKPRQYSCWDDQNRLRMLTVAADDAAYRSCLRATLAAMDGTEPDPTGGATHYHTKAVKPPWADPAKLTATIGDHLFYRGIA